MFKTFVIAEAGVNHNGELSKALELINIAAEAGADAVKFQTFHAENLVTLKAPKAKYQKRLTAESEGQLEMLKKLELSHENHYKLLDFSKTKNIKFLSTAFDSDSLKFIVNDLHLDLLKIPSGEITNGPFLLEHARTGHNIILSTGMSNIQEIEDALSVLAFGYLSAEKPTRELMEQLYDSIEGQKVLKAKVALLHCTSQYPAVTSDINLSAIKTLKRYFNLRVGYSDHSQGIQVSSNAVALGAEIIEKHFTIDKKLPGPDHQASLEPDELSNMIKSIRATEESLGDGIKEIRDSEYENLIVSRKSIVAKEKIKKGELFNSKNITVKRPGSGKSPMEYWDILHQPSDRDYYPDEIIQE